MKFGAHLRESLVPEWRRAYIDYRQLKKLIHRAEAELDALDEANASLASRPAQPVVTLDTAAPSGVSSPSTYAVQRLSRGRSRSATEQQSTKQPLDVADEAAVEPADEADNRKQDEQDGNNADNEGMRDASSDESREVSGDTEHTDKPFASEAATQGRNARRLFRMPPTSVEPSMRFRSWRYSPSLPLDELLSRLPPQTRKFFSRLDKEFERVESFYEEQETKAWARYQELRDQWEELERHKREYNAQHDGATGQRLPARMHGMPHLRQRNLARRVLQGQAHAIHVPGYGAEAAAAHRHLEDYKAARSKIKLASYEFYRWLGLLRQYRILNRTGFVKALKKMEKTCRVPCSVTYGAKIDNAYFVRSSKLEEATRETEDAFARVFEHGNRKKALERLRQLGPSETHHFSTWRSGLLIGASVPLLVEGVVTSCLANTRREIPYWAALLQLFGAEFLPVLFGLLFTLNLISWNYGRVNYVLIFELDPRTMLNFRQYSELPAVLLFAYSLCFWGAWKNFWPDHISPSSYPLAFLVFALALIAFPAPVLYPSARWWLIRSLTRMVSAGLVRVEFRDFFLGDEFNSLYYMMYNWGFLVCLYSHHWPDDANAVCSTNSTWASPILASLPPFWRLGQSVRRFVDSDGMYLHLVNAGKYSVSICYFFLYFNWRIRGSPRDDWSFALTILAATANSIYTMLWDIVLDWNLLKTRSPKHPLLRNELLFKDYVWLYYVAIVMDVLLRFSWVIYLAPEPSVQLRGFLVGLIEVCRRAMWNTYRLESEAIGNQDAYRATRNIPLPYLIPSTGGVDDDGDDSSGGTDSHAPREKILKTLRTLNEALASNLAPVRNALPGKRRPTLSRRPSTVQGESVPSEDAKWRHRRGSRDSDGSSVPTDDDEETPTEMSDARSRSQSRERQSKSSVQQSTGIE